MIIHAYRGNRFFNLHKRLLLSFVSLKTTFCSSNIEICELRQSIFEKNCYYQTFTGNVQVSVLFS